MASNVKMSLDPPSISTTATEARKVTIPVSTDNTNAPGKEANASSTPAPAADKVGKAKTDKKKIATNGDMKRIKAKSKKGKKELVASDSSSSESSDDLESVSSSSDSEVVESDSDTSSEENTAKKKKKRTLRKKQAGHKEKAKSKSAKKSRKHSKSKVKRAESDSEDDSGAGSSDNSDSDSGEDENDEDLGRDQSRTTTHNHLNMLQAQLHNLELQIRRRAAGLGVGGGGAAFDPAGVGMGSLGGAVPGGNALAMGNFATNGLSGGPGNFQLNRYIDPDLGSSGGMPGRSHVPPGRRGVRPPLPGQSRGNSGFDDDQLYHNEGGRSRGNAKGRGKSSRDSKQPRLEFKRVDQVWDSKIHNYKLQDTAENASTSQYSEFLFHVRRTFDWEGKYKATIVDIKSKPLREALQTVMGSIKGVSLVEETPKLDPNMLFL